MVVDTQDSLRTAILPAMTLLPERMASKEAYAMLLAIALQESRLDYRRQRPVAHARGYWQFERNGGVVGVLTHAQTKPFAREICARLDYDPHPTIIWEAIEDNDVLAAAFARLLLWTVPEALPSRLGHSVGWNQYLKSWRPGKPHQHTWNAFFTEAWNTIDLTLMN